MTVKIRLARIGGRHNPLYRINVANSWARRDGRHIEALGEYHAIPDELGVKRISLDFARTRYWLSVGAQPTDTVARLLALAGVLPSLPRGAVRMNTDISQEPHEPAAAKSAEGSQSSP